MDNPTPTVEADGNNRTDTDDNKSMTKSKSSSALHKATEEVQDTLSYLSTNTQSLLRTMRLDVVVLETQRNEDMKCILNQLENQWDAIQHLLRIEEEEKRKEAEREKLESKKKDENKNNKDNMGGKNKRFNSCWANNSGHIDWDNKNDNNNNKDDNTNILQKQTSVRTRLNNGNASRKKRSGNNVQASLSVDNNFDWGGLDDDTKSGRTNSTDDILRALGVEGSQQQGGDDGARGASMGNVHGGGGQQHHMMNDDENDIPLFMRIFKRGESMPQQQQRGGESMQQRRWSLFGGNKDESCKSFDAPLQQQQDEQNQEDQPGPLQKFFASRRRSLDTSSVTGDTYETHPTQESPCTDTSSSSNNDNGSNNPAAIIEEEDDEEEKEEDAELIQSLQVKLRGCDSAASTLHQLLTFQTRNLNDLERQHTTLSTITSKFNATYTKSELEKLSNALQYAKVERRRKARQLEDAKNRKRKCDIQEERLGGELEGIRSELCRLRMEINKDEQPQTALHPNQQQGQQQRNVRFGDATTSGGGGGHGHDRVVIVTTDSGRGGGNRNGSGQPQTQWKTTGIMKKKSANGVPDAS